MSRRWRGAEPHGSLVPTLPRGGQSSSRSNGISAGNDTREIEIGIGMQSSPSSSSSSSSYSSSHSVKVGSGSRSGSGSDHGSRRSSSLDAVFNQQREYEREEKEEREEAEKGEEGGEGGGGERNARSNDETGKEYGKEREKRGERGGRRGERGGGTRERGAGAMAEGGESRGEGGERRGERGETRYVSSSSQAGYGSDVRANPAADIRTNSVDVRANSTEGGEREDKEGDWTDRSGRKSDVHVASTQVPPSNTSLISDDDNHKDDETYTAAAKATWLVTDQDRSDGGQEAAPPPPPPPPPPSRLDWVLQMEVQVLVKLNEKMIFEPDSYDRFSEVIESVRGVILQYIPLYSYLVFLPDDVAAFEALDDVEWIEWIGPYTAEYKIAPEIDILLRKLNDGAVNSSDPAFDLVEINRLGWLRLEIATPLADMSTLGSRLDPRDGTEIAQGLAGRWEREMNLTIAEKTAILMTSSGEKGVKATESGPAATGPVTHSSLNGVEWQVPREEEEKEGMEEKKGEERLVATAASANGVERQVPTEFKEGMEEEEWGKGAITMSLSAKGMEWEVQREEKEGMGEKEGGGVNVAALSPNGMEWQVPGEDKEGMEEEEGGEGVIVTAVSGNGIVIEVPPRWLGWAVGWLANQSWVNWLAPRPRGQLTNMYASAIVQDPAKVIQLDAGADFSPDYGGSRPFWAAGILGKNQVGGVGDTGVDYDR
ncbi:hypothetical protein CBR_g49297 [Chara braunii]|uniref:Uncharacterized protein n=1 Tax=Chara braunii TaxID=69332 RepID=A0A388M4N6_CHABU|nr:hypothetical protein CBR_g49297 [Chara braunii]|eukprot:GBG89506.1 hypothetical protein CBR_g49297 [Chara braunii]